jgi:hypothetical protein
VRRLSVMALLIIGCSSSATGDPSDAGSEDEVWLPQCAVPCVEGHRCFDRGDNLEKVCTHGIPMCVGRHCDGDAGELDTGTGLLDDSAADDAGDAQ